MSRVIDFSKLPLSEEDEKYVRTRGSIADLERAGLKDKPDFDLSGAPSSIPEHELKGEGEPVFDADSAIADESAGSEPSSSVDRTVTPIPQPPPPSQVAVKQNKQNPPTKASSGK